jgi:branched-chain amino acid aminotransferase
VTSACVWVDGLLVAEEEPAVRASDHGVLVGDGVFETAKVLDGTAFALSRHLRRLRRSAEGLGLTVPHTDDELAAAVAEVVAANQPGVGRLRITVTGGPGPLGSTRGEDGPTVILATGPAGDWPAAADVVVVPWPRNERSPVAGLKTTSYAENVVALAAAAAEGAGEALFANLSGHLCEGTGSNVFVGLGGRLVTPPLSSGCLAGITRELLLEITDAVEEDLPIAALQEADEAFLTSSTREVQPIARVDGRVLPACPGPLSEAAAAAFTDLVARDLDP